MEKLKQMRKAAVLTALATGQSVAMAQVVVQYGPVDVASVPTLSEWGMIIMAVMLAGVAAYAMRKNANSKTIMSFALGAVGLLSVALGNHVIKDAWATPAFVMDSPTGGSVTPIPLGVGSISVRNTTQVPLRIISVTPVEVRNAPETTCDPGAIVAPAGTCDVFTGNPS